MAKTFNNLLLFDYDGIVAFNPDSFDIMDQALRQTANEFGRDGEKLDCRSLFATTSGTTESNLAATTCRQLGIKDGAKFLTSFIKNRNGLIGTYQLGVKDSYLQHKGETVYPDFMHLINRLNQTAVGRSTLIGLVTGNPKMVIESRLPPRLRSIFKFFITGEQANTRRELIEIAKDHAQKTGWEPTQDMYSRNTNAFYFDDTQRAILQGIDANVRCVHVPRKPPEFGSLEWEGLDGEIIKKYGITEAKRLVCGNEVSSPTVLVPYYEDGLNSPFIFRDRSVDRSPVFAEGFIDPRAHQEWSRIMEGRFWQDIGMPAPVGLPMQSRK